MKVDNLTDFTDMARNVDITPGRGKSKQNETVLWSLKKKNPK